MSPTPQFMSPLDVVDFINAMGWPEDWPAITAEFTPAHPEWDDDEQAHRTVPAVIRIRAEAPCEWFVHGKLPVVHGVTLQADGEHDLHIDQIYGMTRNAWMALSERLVREHAEPRLLGEIREQHAQAQHVLDLFHTEQSKGGLT